jgi:5-methylthioadenosine/S-adenosylhomocysteine deaminase
VSSTVPALRVDTLIRGATVLTVDAADTVIRDGAVAMSGGRIRAIGRTREIAAAVVADAVIDAHGGLLLPGLVNAHAHLAMTLFRGLADDRDLQGFLSVVLPAESAVLDATTVAAGTRLAIAESIRAGCTTALDMYFWHEAAREVATECGFRLLTGPVLVGGPGPDGRDFAERLEWAAADLQARDADRWLMPHSTYLLDEEQLAAIADLAGQYDARVHVHASENAAEVAAVRRTTGGSPIEVLDRVGLLGPRLTIAHGVVLTADEIARISGAGAAIAHCPASNLKLASGFCPTVALVRAGVTLGLGTDGAASGNDLDLFLAMRLAALVGPASVGDPAAMNAVTVLRAATAGGAAAVGLGDRIGSIEVGKRADLLLLDGDSPALTPCPDPAAAVVYAASRADVRSVWIDGRPVLADRRLTSLDLADALAAVRTIAGDAAAVGDTGG